MNSGYSGELSKCCCETPGHCPVFNKTMGVSPPNWDWCQHASEADRNKLYKSCHERVCELKTQKHRAPVMQFYDELPPQENEIALCVIPANLHASQQLEETRELLVNYAKKCKADYIELSGDQCEEWPLANKYRLHQVTTKYKKTLYVDCDVVIKKESPDIFKLTPDDKISAFNEFKIHPENEWIKDEQEAICFKLSLPSTEVGFGVKMLNGGVMVIPQSLADYYNQPKEPYPKIWCFDQHLLTLILPEEKFFDLDEKFNTEYISKEFWSKLGESYFVHVNNCHDDSLRKILIKRICKESLSDNNTPNYSLYSTLYSIFGMHCGGCPNHDDAMRCTNFVNKYCKVGQDADTSSVQILTLGHSQEQFDSIEDRDYIKKINLNELDTDYGNEWGEARIFDVDFDSIFSRDKTFLGTVTASWNKKYTGWHPIDRFEKWASASALTRSKNKKFIIGSHVDCICTWYSGYNIFSTMVFKHFTYKHLYKFMKSIGLQPNHGKVMYSNQIIAHRDTVKSFFSFIKDNEVLERTKFFLKRHKLEGKSEYYDMRKPAYFLEFVSLLWYSNQDGLIFSPQEIPTTEWYHSQEINKRVSW
jgi:hypothetical protein